MPDKNVAPPSSGQTAAEFHKCLTTWIEDFGDSLDDAHEVGIRLFASGQSVAQFHFKSMKYWDPHLICFRGLTDDRDPVEFIQQIGEVSVQLMKVPRLDAYDVEHEAGRETLDQFRPFLD